jgi:hypothetical protein
MPSYLRAIIMQVIFFVLLFPTLTPAQNGPFINLSAITVGKGPTGVAVGDLNGDGIPDIVTTNSADGTVSIILGNGDGSYGTPKTLATNAGPGAIVIADFNGDGNRDLIVGTTSGNSTVQIFLGNGDGTFEAPATLNFGSERPVAFQVADFNGDGKLDLAIATVDSVAASVNIFLGKGDGTFALVGTGGPGFSGSIALGGLVAGDFDGNGTVDLAVIVTTTMSGSAVAVVSNDGTGNLTLKKFYNLNSVANALTAADFNGDGHLDLAVTEASAGNVAVLLGNGDGTFQSEVDHAAGQNPSYIIAVDLNGDGRTDLITASLGQSNLSVLLGKGDGTFQTAVSYPTLGGPVQLATADANRDGHTDVVVTNSEQNSVQVFLGEGDGTLRTGSYPAGSSLESITSGDFNGDGNPDFAVVGSGTVSIYLSDGHGGFKAAGSFSDGVSSAEFESIVAGDFNNDGKIDLAVGSSNLADEEFLDIFLGSGDGTFQGHLAGNYGLGNILAFDLNGDGNLDVVSPFLSGVEVDFGVGSGSFHPVDLPVSLGAAGIAVGDFNGDGKLDIAVATGDIVELFLGNGDGTFQSVITSHVSGLGVFSLAAGDFNGDGILDLVVGSINPGENPLNTSGPVFILSGKGDGSFQQMPGVVTEFGTLVAVSDFNGDGIPDLAISRADTGSVDVMQGKGDGTFVQVAEYPVGPDSGAMVVADFNLDGAPDLAVANSGSVAVLTNVATKGINALTTTQLTFSPPAVVGEALKLTASVMGKNGVPTGTITFKEDGVIFATTALASGQTQVTSPALSVGPHDFTALYTGDPNFNGSLSTRLVINVGAASSTTRLTASPGKLGEPVTFTATVSPEFSGTPSGTVQFFADGQPIGAAPLNGGQAALSTTSLSLGAHKIEADYSGDQNFTASVATINENVGKGVSGVTITSTANPGAFGQSITLTATVTNSEGATPTGQVVFEDSTTVYGIVTLTSGAAQVSISTLTAGKHKITAQYEGDSSDTAASASLQQNINGIPTTTSVVTSTQPSSFGQAVTFTATVTAVNGIPGGTVTFKNGSSILGTVTLTGGSAQLQLSTLSGGNHIITALYNGSGTFAASSGSVPQIVEKTATVTLLTSSLNPSPAGQTVTLTAVVTSSAAETATGNVTFKDGKTVLGTAALVNGQAQLTTALLSTGTHKITSTFVGTTNFGSSSSTLTQVIQ